MITPYYIYIRAREERKEGKREGRDGIAPDGTKKKESEGGGLQGMRREDFKRGKAPHPTFF